MNSVSVIKACDFNCLIFTTDYQLKCFYDRYLKAVDDLVSQFMYECLFFQNDHKCRNSNCLIHKRFPVFLKNNSTFLNSKFQCYNYQAVQLLHIFNERIVPNIIISVRYLRLPVKQTDDN